MLAADLSFFSVSAADFLSLACPLKLKHRNHDLDQRLLKCMLDEDGNTCFHVLLKRAAFSRPAREKSMLPLCYAWSRTLLVIERMLEVKQQRTTLKSMLTQRNSAGESIIELLWVALGRSQQQHDRAKRGELKLQAWDKKLRKLQHVPRVTHFVLQWQQALMPRIQPLLERHLIKDCAGVVAQVSCSVQRVRVAHRCRTLSLLMLSPCFNCCPSNVPVSDRQPRECGSSQGVPVVVHREGASQVEKGEGPLVRVVLALL